MLAVSRRYQLVTFVETGTDAGHTVEAVRHHFSKVYSIESKPENFRAVQARFSGVENVKLFEGFSSLVLPCVLQGHGISRALFWLDAHAYDQNGGYATPEGDQVPGELRAIAAYAPESLVIVDDVEVGAHGFTVNSCYPFTVPDGWHFRHFHRWAFLHRGGYILPDNLSELEG